MRTVELKSREEARKIINYLANEGYWGNTITYYDVEHGAEEIKYVVNEHVLSNVSDRVRHVVIDNGYCCADPNAHIVALDGVERNGVDYCLYKLGF